MVSLSCQSRRTKFSITAIDATVPADSISFVALAQNYRSYHGKYVDTKGLFGQAFERFGLCPDSMESTNQLSCFWLGLDPNIGIDHSDLKRMNGKIVRIKGILDTTHKGHLGAYYGTIRNIYFWEQQ